MQTDKKCKMPNMMTELISRVAKVKAIEITNKRQPRFILEREKHEEIPEIKINDPAKNGCPGVQNANNL